MYVSFYCDHKCSLSSVYLPTIIIIYHIFFAQLLGSQINYQVVNMQNYSTSLPIMVMVDFCDNSDAWNGVSHFICRSEVYKVSGIISIN